jgi:acetyl esterase/lipase
MVVSGGDETTKVGVAGDSAGGLISASACHTVKNIAFQVRIDRRLFSNHDYCRM